MLIAATPTLISIGFHLKHQEHVEFCQSRCAVFNHFYFVRLSILTLFFTLLDQSHIAVLEKKQTYPVIQGCQIHGFPYKSI